jgi:hypothetical protein
MPTRGSRPTLSLAVALACALALVGCRSSSDDATGTAAPGHPTGDAAASASTSSAAGTTTTTVPARASRATPLAERVFRVEPKAANPTQQAAVQALQDYLDGMVTAFATNNLGRTDLRRRTSPGMYADARRLIAEQISKGYVLYGRWSFMIQPRGASSRAAVIGVCIDQSRTRRHDANTDAAGRRNDTPRVQLTYTLNQLATGWVVVDDAGRAVTSCPG